MQHAHRRRCRRRFVGRSAHVHVLDSRARDQRIILALAAASRSDRFRRRHRRRCIIGGYAVLNARVRAVWVFQHPAATRQHTTPPADESMLLEVVTLLARDEPKRRRPG